MNVTDYFGDGKNWSIKLHEKNGKTIVMPVQHKLEEYLDAYIAAAGGADGFPYELSPKGRRTKRQPLFRSTPRVANCVFGFVGRTFPETVTWR